MKKFLVFLNDVIIEEVFYDSSFSAEEVRRSLITHDGYDSNIRVIKQ